MKYYTLLGVAYQPVVDAKRGIVLRKVPKESLFSGKTNRQGETRTNRAGHQEVLQGGRWHLQGEPQQQLSQTQPQKTVPEIQGADNTNKKESIEDATLRDAQENYQKHKTKYLESNGTFDADGTLKSVVLNTDEWRTSFPQYVGTNAADVHEASSYLNKKLYNELLPAMRGKGNNRMLILAGGGGSGKGTATREHFDQSQYPIVLDQASDNYPKLEAKIDEAISQGYTPEHVFIDRPPELALAGIASRALNLHKRGELPRTVPAHIGFEANIKARKATLDLLKRRSDVDVKIVDNTSNERGAARLITDRQEAIQYLEKRIAEEDHNVAGGLKDKLHQNIAHGFLSGEIPEHIAKGLTSHEYIENARNEQRKQ